MWDIIWDLDDDPDGNVEHIAQHGLTKDDVRNALDDPIEHDISRSSGRFLVYGLALDGRSIIAVFDQIDEFSVYPVTAYEVEKR